MGLIVLFFYAYEHFALWSSPWLTAWLIVGYFLAAFLVDTFFQGAAFCKYVCPIGQFNFFGSLVSPLEVKVREADICSSCTTKDCITLGRNTGKPHPSPAASLAPAGSTPAPGSVRTDPAPVHLSLVAAPPAPRLSTFDRGCELWLFQQRKYGNQDCTFCLDCVHACPYDNVTVAARTPLAELSADRFRSGIGYLTGRLDLAALVAVLVFASHANAFAMIGPGYELRARLTSALGLRSDALPLLLLLLLALLVAPAVMLGTAAAVTRRLTAARDPVRELAARYLYGIVPLGISMWVAHYSFHFLTGALTLVPVVQSFLQDVGLRAADPQWGLGPLVPGDWLFPIEATILYAGAFASSIVLVRIAERQTGARGAPALRAAAPWIALCLALLAAGLWILVQPMQIRGTMLAALAQLAAQG